MVRTQSFHCQVLGLSPGWGTKIPQALEHGQKNKQIKKKKPLIQRLMREHCKGRIRLLTPEPTLTSPKNKHPHIISSCAMHLELHIATYEKFFPRESNLNLIKALDQTTS